MKIVITSHGDLCEGILISYAMIAGDTSHFTVVKLDEKGISDFSVRLNNVLDSLLTSNEFVLDSILQAGQDAISLAPTAITNNDDLDF